MDEQTITQVEGHVSKEVSTETKAQQAYVHT
jgi:hypothetical protein